MPSKVQPSFAKGEISPSLYGRTDTALYQVALRSAYNMLVHPQGGISNRPGLVWLGYAKDHSYAPRLIPFHFSNADQYVLEFGNLYMRVIRNDAYVLDDTTTKTITGITNANPGVVTTSAAHGYSTGDQVYISGVVGMTEVNGRWFKVGTTTSDTFQLKTQQANANVNTTNYTPYSSAGSVSKLYEITTPYATADLDNIKYAQSGDVMTLTHKTYSVRDLTRTDHDAWTLTEASFSPTQTFPTGISVTAGVVGDRRARYTVTAIGDYDESLAGTSTTSFNIDGATKANPCSISTSSSHGFETGDQVYITGISGMTELNGRQFYITVVDADDFTLDGENSTNYTTYSSGGTVNRTFHQVTLANISGITAANPGVVTVAAGHGVVDSETILIADVAGMTQVNNRRFTSTSVNGTSITLSSENTSGYTAYTSGGALWKENTARNTVTWTAASGAKRYAVYKEQHGIFGKIGETTALTFLDNNLFIDLSTTPPQQRLPFRASGYYPGAVGFYEQRAVYGGSTNEPSTSRYSRTGTTKNMTSSVPLRSDDAITATLSAREANEIRHYVPGNDLTVFTSGGEWRVNAGAADAGFAFDTIKQKLQSTWGSSHLRPFVVGNLILFTEENKASVRTLGYDFSSDTYKGVSLSLLAEHLTHDYALADWSYAHAQDSRIYMVRSDGLGLTMTFDPEQEVVAWTRLETDGEFERVCVLRHSEDEMEDKVYYVVKRTINGTTVRFIERLATRPVTSEISIGEAEGGASVVWNITGAGSITEGNTGTYTVSYTGDALATGVTATIAVATAAGTATSSTDYTALSTTLTFTGGGVTTKTVAVSTIEDTAVEGTEDFDVRISSPSVGSIGTSQVDTNIIDDDSTPVLTYEWTDSETAASATTPRTYTGMAIGTAASDRMVVVYVKTEDAAVPTGVTIAGNAMTKIVESIDGSDTSSIWARIVSSGTTADVIVTHADAPSSQGISVYAVYGKSSVTASDTASSIANPPSVSVTIPANGVAIGGVCGGSSTYTWSGLTEDFDQLSPSMSTASRSVTSATTPTITSTPSSGSRHPLVVAAWGP